ncbi:M56 family metallopeptidase [Roseivirga misakiensis]|uniref:Peptidase M56 domain-containing protein n=1 Tax=Roseivirga misakiensis TaxID=1563681 RepID=A0A1E5T6H2_9BACT|nr:M56 family metallopeptidase [Roseivirga misakiensis]OEK06960.1 hypothetical protein BFP71_04700 [Roseivirga misakiensis]
MEINSNILEALGLTLLDSLWQGVIILAIAFLGLAILRKVEAKWRHNLLLVCILMLPMGGTLSFVKHYQSIEVQTEFSERQFVTNSIDATQSQEQEVRERSIVVVPPIIQSTWIADKAHWVAKIWLVGLILFSIRGIGGLFYLNRIKRKAIEIQDSKLNILLNKLKKEFSIRSEVLLRESSMVLSPMVSGYFKPMIIFPIGLIQGLTSDEVEVILAHELAHLKRNDFIVSLIITALRSIYFYHPAYWWLQSQLDNEREYASDEMVMSKQSNGLLLVKALAKTQEYTMTTPAVGFAGNSKNQLLKRVNRIMKKQQRPNWLSGLVTVLVLGSAFMLMSQSQKKESDNKLRSSFIITPDTPKEIKDSLYETLGSKFSMSYDIDTGISAYNGAAIPNDTTKLALAIQEIIQDESPIKVNTNDRGEVVSIKRNSESLKGDEFRVYRKAYRQLSQYALTKAGVEELEKLSKAELTEVEKVAVKRNEVLQNQRYLQQLKAQDLLDGLVDELEELDELDEKGGISIVSLKEKSEQLKEIAKRYGALNVEKEAERLKAINTRSLVIQDYARSLEKQAQLLEYVSKIREQAIAEGLPKEESDKLLEQIIALEKEIKANAVSLTPKVSLKGSVSEIYEIKTVADRVASLRKEMKRVESLMEQGDVSKEEALLMMEELKLMENTIGEYRARKYDEFVQKDSRNAYNIFINEQDKTGKSGNDENDLMVHTRVTPTYETFTFKEGESRLHWVGYALDGLFSKKLNKKVFLLNGKVMKDWTFKNFESLDFNKVKAIDFAADKDMKKYFGDVLSKKILRNYDSVISITTN